MFVSSWNVDSESSCSQSCATGSKEKTKEATADKMENECKPLLNKNTVLGLLSELVKSYSGVAQLIAEYEIQRPGNLSNSQVGRESSNFLAKSCEAFVDISCEYMILRLHLTRLHLTRLHLTRLHLTRLHLTAQVKFTLGLGSVRNHVRSFSSLIFDCVL